LMYTDKLSMAHSLEIRVPYLDRTVVEFAQRLHASYKIRRGTGKWLHRKVSQRFLDPRILRRKKRGFAVNVVDGWLQSSLRSKLLEMLLDQNSLMFEVLDPHAVRRVLDEHKSGKEDNYKLLFSLVMFEQWLRSNRSDKAQLASV
jgi:asparagine synthase (glutamine-hydrolysing)